MKKQRHILQITNRLSAFIIIILLLPNIIIAQNFFYLNAEKSNVRVNGTSSLHDWSMQAKKIESSLDANISNNELTDLSNVNFVCKVIGIVSKEKDMDKKAYNALKYEKNPEIKFKMQKIENLVSKGGILSGSIYGDLTIAGKTNRISFPFKGKLVANSLITIEANYKINMLDYSIDPPTAMLGMLKTGKDVTITLLLNYINK
ncbi:MAG: hypothetical protein A2X02_08735 [Bacteroidetes bacterium GWF2_29_10]|nr:MAG: hypothetical protein A2X02_08735 [Bacteroidetes bacterium GWF2_29_10]